MDSEMCQKILNLGVLRCLEVGKCDKGLYTTVYKLLLVESDQLYSVKVVWRLVKKRTVENGKEIDLVFQNSRGVSTITVNIVE